MDRLYSVPSSLPLEEFQKVASKYLSKIETAQMLLVYAYKKLTTECGYHLEQCNYIIHSILSLRKTIRAFVSMLDSAVYLPCSIWSLRYPLIRILHNIDQHMSDTVLLILVLKDIFRTSSEKTIIQQRKIQRRIEMLLQDCGDSIENLGTLLEQVSGYDAKRANWQ